MYEAVALSGGGQKAVAHLGALACLEDVDMLRQIHSFAGSSGGAVVASLCAADKRGARELLQFYMQNDIAGPRRLVNPFKKFGVVSLGFSPLELCLQRATGKRFPSFRDVCKRTGKRLYVSAFRVRDGETVFFGPDDDVEVLAAVKASTAVPLVIPPVDIGGDLYVDGAMTAYVPTGACRGLKTLGLVVHTPVVDPSGGLAEYINALVSSGIRHMSPDTSGDTDTCVIRCENDDNLMFRNMSPDVATRMFINGYESMHSHVGLTQ